MGIIRVLVIDDHPVVRDGINVRLSKTTDIVVVGEASTGEEALKLVAELSPDVLLLDIEMPGLNGIEVTRRLKEINSPVKILALSAYNDEQYVRQTLASGAAGYLIKDEMPEKIVEAIRGLVGGQEGWLSRKAASTLISQTRQETSQKTVLNKRELETLRLVVAGKTNFEISGALSISEKTVEKRLSEMFGKMGVSSRVEAAVRAVREGLL